MKSTSSSFYFIEWKFLMKYQLRESHRTNTRADPPAIEYSLLNVVVVVVVQLLVTLKRNTQIQFDSISSWLKALLFEFN